MWTITYRIDNCSNYIGYPEFIILSTFAIYHRQGCISTDHHSANSVNVQFLRKSIICLPLAMGKFLSLILGTFLFRWMPFWDNQRKWIRRELGARLSCNPQLNFHLQFVYRQLSQWSLSQWKKIIKMKNKVRSIKMKNTFLGSARIKEKKKKKK